MKSNKRIHISVGVKQLRAGVYVKQMETVNMYKNLTQMLPSPHQEFEIIHHINIVCKYRILGNV